MRRHTGKRRHVARVEKHDGPGMYDEHGTPTFTDDGDWQVVIPDWYCELKAVRGGEVIRGRQVSDTTTHVMFGNYYPADKITPDMRVRIGNSIYNVVAAYDLDGDSREMRVETKSEG